MNPDRNVQLPVALLGEFTSSTSPINKLLVVPTRTKIILLTLAQPTMTAFTYLLPYSDSSSWGEIFTEAQSAEVQKIFEGLIF